MWGHGDTRGRNGGQHWHVRLVFNLSFMFLDLICYFRGLVALISFSLWVEQCFLFSLPSSLPSPITQKSWSGGTLFFLRGPNTLVDFWRLVDGNDVTTIVSLGSERETESKVSTELQTLLF